MIASMSKTGELKELKKDVEQTEDYDMCKAIDMMVADGEKTRRSARNKTRRGTRRSAWNRNRQKYISPV